MKELIEKIIGYIPIYLLTLENSWSRRLRCFPHNPALRQRRISEWFAFPVDYYIWLWVIALVPFAPKTFNTIWNAGCRCFHR